MTENILDKLATHLAMEARFPSQADTPPTIETDIASVTALIARLELGDYSVVTQAHELLDRYSSRTSEIQEWCHDSLQTRFQDHVQIPHTRQIDKYPGIIEPRNNPEQRLQRVQEYGFQFASFNLLLTKLGFWEKVGPLLEQLPVEKGGVPPGLISWESFTFSLDNPYFNAFMNVLNGSSPIDYEGAFSALEEQFDLLKKYKYGMDDAAISTKKETGKSPLSIPDLLSVLVIDALNTEAGFDGEKKRELDFLNAFIVCDKIPDAERIDYYQRLKNEYRGLPATALDHLLQETLRELALPEGWEGKLKTIADINSQVGNVDVVIPLASSDEGLNAYKAREVLHLFPHAFMIPSGGRAPHELQSQKKRSEYTEADLMVAMAMANDLPKIYPWKYPDTPDLSTAPPINQYDILAPDTSSKTTEMNASHITARLRALQELQQRTLKIVIVTNNLHSSRALVDFRKRINCQVDAKISVWENDECPHLTGIVEERKIHGLQYAFGEYIKHLYMVSMDT